MLIDSLSVETCLDPALITRARPDPTEVRSRLFTMLPHGGPPDRFLEHVADEATKIAAILDSPEGLAPENHDYRQFDTVNEAARWAAASRVQRSTNFLSPRSTVSDGAISFTSLSFRYRQ